MSIELANAPAASGNAISSGVWGFEDGIAKTFPVRSMGRLDRTFVVSRDLTIADTRGGVLTSTSAGGTVLVLPTMATLGYARNPSAPVELVFMFQRGGDGPLFVNRANSSITINWNDLDPQYLPKGHPPVMLVSNGLDSYDAW